MAATNSGFSYSLVLALVSFSLLLLGIVLANGWYFQSSLVELRTQMIAQQQDMMEQRIKIEVQGETIQQLKETVKEQNKLFTQLQINQIQQKINNHFNNVPDTNSTVLHSINKRSTDKTLELLRGRDGRDGRDGFRGPKGMVGLPGPKGDTGSACKVGMVCENGTDGPPGPKGDRGIQGDRGNIGPQGPRGLPGERGFNGVNGRAGAQGDAGPPGDAGPRGPRGLTGSRGSRGSPGIPGSKGEKGEFGAIGPPGPAGNNGSPGVPGRDGAPGEDGRDGSAGKNGRYGPQGIKGQRGAQGRDGLPGAKGLPGKEGREGTPGQKGQKGECKSGVVYVCWGCITCPNTGAELVYSGRTGGARYNQGGGSNPQCLPLDPNYYKTISGAQNSAYMYGAEYEGTNGLVGGTQDTDVPCTVCYVPTRSSVYMIPAKYTCPKGWTREYFGYLMSQHNTHRRSQFTCVEQSLKSINNSHPDQNGVLFYPVEGVCGSLPCPPYEQTKELSCAVCTR